MHIVQSPGGVERYILMLLRNMDLSKYDNILVCSLDYKEENYKDLVIAFEQIDMIRNIRLKSDLKVVFQVRKLIKKYNPDIVYMHSSKAGAIGRIANIGLKNCRFYNPHGWAFNMECGSMKKALYCWIEKLLNPLCDIVIAISDYEKQSAIKNKICNPNKIKVIFNGIDIEGYVRKRKISSLKRKDLGISDNAYIIGTVGRITKQKAPDSFIMAANLIKKQIPEAFFLMVGDGDMQEQIENSIKKLGLKDFVLITGWVDEPMEYINLFDQAMLLSRWEGFGLVLAEYMLAGKPIIATEVDAIPNLISNRNNGLLIRVDDINAIVQASIEIFNNRDLGLSMVAEGLTAVYSKYNINRVVSELDTLFLQ